MSWKGSLAVLAIVSAVGGACTAPAAESRPSAPLAPSATASAVPAKTGDLVYVRNMSRNGEIAVLEGDTGKQLARYPSGVTNPDWSLVYGTQLESGNTVLRATDLARNVTVNERRIDANGYPLQLPSMSLTGDPGGFSPNARWLALTTRADYSSTGSPTKSPFAVLDAKLEQPTKLVELPGSFTFDAISDSGQNLYVEEHLGQNGEDGYRVRVYDLQSRQLLPGFVVDKSVTADRMAGTRVATLASPDGLWQFTLYWRQGGNPFIHAIRLEERWSLCLFLPVETRGEEDFAWSFVPSPDGRIGYAINSLKGYVASIALTSATVIRAAAVDLKQTQAPNLGDELARFFFPVAEAKSEMFSLSVVSPDGKTLYASGDFGRKLFAIDTDTFAVKGRYAVDSASGPIQLIALGVSPDGARLYGLDAQGKSLVRIDAATGRVLSVVAIPGPYFGRILRVVSH